MTTVAVELRRIVAFEIISDYTINIAFEDGEERTIDFAPILYGPIFGQLRDRTLFDKVALDTDFGALVWPNGADIEPAVLYDWPNHLERISEQHRKQHRK